MNDELVYGTEPTVRRGVVGWAVVVALGLGMAWGLASVFSGWRLAWLAPVVALAIAWAWRDAAAVRTRGTAMGAAALVLLSCAAAWGSAALVGRQTVTSREMELDPGLVTTAVRDWMFAEGNILDPLEHGALDETEDAENEEDPTDREAAEAIPEVAETEADAAPPLRPEAQVRQRLATMDDAEKKRIVAWYVNKPGGQVARREVTQRAWRWTDAVWVLAGAWLAFRLSGPRASEEDYEDDE